MNTKWELTNTDSWEVAQRLANEGWELVSVITSSDEDMSYQIFYFKRVIKA